MSAESHQEYPGAIQLNARWRVVLCRAGIQWILQCRIRSDRPERVTSDDWRGRSYFRTRSALIGSCNRFCGGIDPVAATILKTLPDRIESVSTLPERIVESVSTSAGKKPTAPTTPRNHNSREKPPGTIAAEWEMSMATTPDEAPPLRGPDNPMVTEECEHLIPRFLCRRCQLKKHEGNHG
jgi:hypothetical protein